MATILTRSGRTVYTCSVFSPHRSSTNPLTATLVRAGAAVGSGEGSRGRAPSLREPARVVPATADWQIVLAATLAEAAGARVVATTVPGGEAIAFAGFGADAATAERRWLEALERCAGCPEDWCGAFAIAVDEELDEAIDDPETRARVARVARWLAYSGLGDVIDATSLDADDSSTGADAGRALVHRTFG